MRNAMAGSCVLANYANSKHHSFKFIDFRKIQYQSSSSTLEMKLPISTTIIRHDWLNWFGE